MMHAVIVVESIWGNTESIAREIAAGLGDGRIDVMTAVSAPRALDGDVDLLVVGGPTHAFSMSTKRTRESALQQGAEQVPARGIREWIAAHGSPPRAIPVATFDTRVVTPRLPGSAAKKAMKRLVALGYRPAVKPETFGVHGYAGPVADGELERARDWGGKLREHIDRRDS
jgi:hypothetical protein